MPHNFIVQKLPQLTADIILPVLEVQDRLGYHPFDMPHNFIKHATKLCKIVSSIISPISLSNQKKNHYNPLNPLSLNTPIPLSIIWLSATNHNMTQNQSNFM